MALNEIIRSTGDIRRVLGQTMIEIKTGELEVSRGQCIAALAKELTASLQVEINVAKVRVAMLQAGHDIGSLTQIGKMIIEDDSPATLSGKQ